MKMWKISFLLSTVILIQFIAFSIVQGYPDKNLSLLTTINTNSTTATASVEQENLNENLLSGKNVKLIQFTNILRNSINFDIKPCDDFYSYACKKYENNEKIDNNKINFINNNNQEDIKRITKILENFYKTEDDNNLSDVEIKSKEFYLSCRSTRNLQQLRNTDTYKSTGGWPILEENNWKFNNSLELMLAEFSTIQENLFFSQTIRIQNNQRIIKIYPILYKKMNLNRYNRTIYETSHQYGILRTKLQKIHTNLLEFERKRIEIINNDDTNNQLKSNELTIIELNEKFPQFNWNIYFQKIFGKSLKLTDRIVIKNGIILEKILKLLNETKPRIISNYIWYNYLTGKTQKDCINLLQKYFHPIYETIMNRPTYNQFEMLKVFTEISKAYDKIFDKSLCFNEKSKKNSKFYLNQQINILLNGDPKLNTIYDSLRINHRNFYESLENCAKHLAKHKKYDTILINFNKLFRQSSNNNKLLYPDSIMSMIFGSVGINLAYEMIGAGDIDNNSLISNQYNWCGDNENWQTNQINQNFTICSQYFPNDIREKLIKNPKYSIIILRNYFAEKQALLALKSWLNLNEQKNIDRNLERKLLNKFPNLTNLKIFFINAIKTSWCWTDNKEFLNTYFMELFHNEFNEIFQCNLDSEMNKKYLRKDKICEIN